MRSLDSAKDAWQELQQYKDIRELKTAVKLDGRSSVCNDGLRSACWKAFLIFDNVETTSWPETLTASRSAYNSFRLHFLRHLEHADELSDPLNEDSNTSWTDLKKDDDLRAEILQDVERCMPENLYFRQPETQQMLLDILFIFCKLNPDVGYRQGMHELLAPILWAVERDAIDLGVTSKVLGEDKTVEAVFNAGHIEHDTFALFAQVMQSAKSFYEQTSHRGSENPMVVRSRRIMNDLLPQVDEELAKHLERIEIVPQVFLLRWIRLLFGREFQFDDVLPLWDAILAEDPSLEVVDHISLAMLLRIRWQLLEADYNGAMTILLHYPQPEKDFQAQSFALDGLYLRDHMTRDSGSYLVMKYTGRSMTAANPIRPLTPPALQRNITTFSGANAAAKAIAARTNSLSSSRVPRQVTNMEALLQSKARDLYKLGGQAVRSAVDEVHKRAQEIRDAQTPAPPPSFYRHRAARTSSATGTLLGRVSALEKRNKQLAKLLESATSELWEFQRKAAEARQSVPDEEKPTLDNDVQQLSVAIAKVQFVQVYLEDSSLPVPQDEEDEKTKEGSNVLWQADDPAEENDHPLRPPSQQASTSQAFSKPAIVVADDNGETLADPNTFDDFDEDPFEPEEPTIPQPVRTAGQKTASKSSIPTQRALAPSRPTIAESSYSFMLGQSGRQVNADTNASATASLSVAREQHRKARGFLFGDAADNGEEDTTVMKKDARGKQRKKPSKGEQVRTDAGEVLNLQDVGSP